MFRSLDHPQGATLFRAKVCEERIPTRCNNTNDLFSIPDVDY